MSALPRELILASAGSGKTFRISSRIIGLLARGEAPAAVLASTFTRKAAGEILERVLVRLARAAMDPREAAELAKHAFDRDAAHDAAFWRDLLARVVRELHRLDIGTLDAFFVRAVGSFGHDLGLPPTWRIADEPTAERARADALQDLLRRLDPGARAELVRGLAGGGVKRSVQGSLERLVRGVLQIHHDLDPAAPGWGALDGLAGPGGDDRERRRALAERVASAPVAAGTGGDDARWRSALETCAAAIEAGKWERLLKQTIFCNAIWEPDKGYHRKAYPLELVALLEEAASLAREALAAEYARRARALGRLATLYADAYDARVRAAGVLDFEDVTRLLTGPRPVGARDDLFYRLDGATRHVLLDEFQDTSLLQWKALQPLADEVIPTPGTAAGAGAGSASASAPSSRHGQLELGLDADPGGSAEARPSSTSPSGGAAVIVADPKQSIYGWRGAAPAVVEHAGERFGLPRRTLATSYRSSQVVLDAVNRIFERLPYRWVFEADEVDQATAAEWSRAFTPHVASERRPGHVTLRAGPCDAGRGASRPRLIRHAAELVARLHREAPGRSVGVLTRTNVTVARLILELRALGVDASEEGGTALTDSMAVVSVLALLRLADHPIDRLAAYHVARTPVGEVVGLEDPDDGGAVRRVVRRTRRRLLERGYGATLSGLARRLAAACDAREAVRLRQLAQLGYAHDAACASRPGAADALRADAFVRLAEATRAESPGTAAVRVMTVHQAKGLEFDIVVLPELEEYMLGRGADIAPHGRRAVDTGPVTHAYPYIPGTVRRLFDDAPELVEAFAQARAARMRDALSFLYVAVTRARHALHIVIAADPQKGPGATRSHARLVREALAPHTLEDAARVDAGDVLFEHGDPDWHRAVRPEDARVATATPAGTPPTGTAATGTAATGTAATGTGTPAGTGVSVGAADGPVVRLRTGGARSRGFGRVKPSGLGRGRMLEVRSLLGTAASPAARARGTLVHAWLEAMEWIDDGLPDAERRAAIARAIHPDLPADVVAEAGAWLEDRLARPEARAALSRARYPRHATVERELPFLHRVGDALLEGVIDRLVLVREPGGVESDGGEAGDVAGVGGVDIAGAEGVQAGGGEAGGGQAGAGQADGGQVDGGKADGGQADGGPGGAGQGGGARVVRAEILDFKTDALDPGDDDALAERADQYAPQLRAYAAAVAELWGLEVETVSAALLFLDVGRLVEVEPTREAVPAG